MSNHFSMGAINKTTNNYEYPKIANKINKYKCPFCEKDVIFRNGKIKQPQFAHYKSDNPCSYYEKPNETQIHKDAKLLMKTLLDNKNKILFYRECYECLLEENTIFEYKITDNDYNENTIASMEYRFNYNNSNRSADVALVENKDIVSYEDNCKDNVDYTLKFTRNSLETADDDRLYKLLKLEESETENFNTLDETGKLKIFERVEDIIKYFVDFRLSYYQLRKDHQLNKLQNELKVLGNRGKFIKAILDGKIIVNNKSKEEIVSQIESLAIEMIDGSYDYLLRMPIYSLTKEMFEKLKEDFKIKKEEIEKLKLVDPKDMYLDDLSELKKKLK